MMFARARPFVTVLLGELAGDAERGIDIATACKRPDDPHSSGIPPVFNANAVGNLERMAHGRKGCGQIPRLDLSYGDVLQAVNPVRRIFDCVGILDGLAERGSPPA